MAFVVPFAYADGGVNVTDVGFRNGTTAYDVDPAPSADEHAASFYVYFDKNVAYANNGRDDSFIENNLSKIHLRKCDTGEIVPYTVAWTVGDEEQRRFINLRLDDWLEPLTKYELVCDAGIMAANGIDVLEEPYVFEFTTSAATKYGFTVYQIAVAAVVVIMLALGIIFSAIHLRFRNG